MPQKRYLINLTKKEIKLIISGLGCVENYALDDKEAQPAIDLALNINAYLKKSLDKFKLLQELAKKKPAKKEE